MIFLILFPLLLLAAGPGMLSAGISVGIYLIGSIVLSGKKTHKKAGGFFLVCFPLLSAVIALILGGVFYVRWQDHSIFAALESIPTMPAKRICGICASLLAALSVFGIDYLLSLFLKKESIRGLGGTTFENIFIAMTSALTVSLTSRCSPFFAFNDWVDPHTMFSVGKGIIRGMLPYRDVYEQKGPLILAIHALGAWISFDSFIGIWLIEIVSCFFFLFFAWRIIKLRFGRPALVLLPILALIICSAVSFDQGDSAEEFCLPLVMYALFVGIHRLWEDELPVKKEWILIGVTSGCMLWIKYSMLGFYLGWILALYLFSRKTNRQKEIVKGIGWIAAGVGLITLPILLWFAFSGGLYDLFNVYFYQNMFLYPKTADMYGRFAVVRNLLNGMLNFIVFSTAVFLIDLIGLIWLSRQKTKKPVYLLVLISFLSTFLVVYFSGRFYSYYSLIFGAFTVFGLMGIWDILTGRTHIAAQSEAYAGTLISMILCAGALGAFLFSGNMRSLAFEKNDFLQYRAKAYIDSTGIDEPTLMNYGFLDMGVSMPAGIVPNQRFFCSFNLPLKDIETEQNACLENGCTDFVLTFMLKIDSPNYRLVEQYDSLYNFAGIIPKYNLYQKVAPDE